jgi:hypothetical protein
VIDIEITLFATQVVPHLQLASMQEAQKWSRIWLGALASFHRQGLLTPLRPLPAKALTSSYCFPPPN